jgi:hypothetical protein
VATSQSSKAPASFVDGINAAMQDIASAMSAPDADLHFGSEVIKLMGTFIQSKHAPQGQGGHQPAPGGGGQTPPGAGGTPPGMSTPGGPAGGGAQNPQMPSMQPPSGPAQPGSGPTPGLSPNPDEMRRVMQEVAGQ